MKITVGTCSICGGPVQVHSDWCSVNPEIPKCGDCGATAAMHGQVIPMKPANDNEKAKWARMLNGTGTPK